MSVAPATRGLICLALAAAVLVAGPSDDTLRRALALVVLVGGLWLTQAIPLVLTALLVPVLAVAGGLVQTKAALAPFAHPTIFLFLGGFALATALQQQGLDRALAHAVLRAARGHQGRAMVLLAAATAVVSMGISNTASAAMMLPLALGLVGPAERRDAPSREAIFVLLAVAYSASIGGMATLVGTPPNALAGAYAGISYAAWLAWGLPLAVVLWCVMLGVLWLLLRPRFGGRIAIAPQPLAWTPARRLTLVIFGLTVLAWVGSGPLARVLGVRGDIDAWIALVALIALVASGCVRWPELEARTEWSVLLLFGGGLALGEVMQASGATGFLTGHALAALDGLPLLLVVAGMVVCVILFSELLSNTASAALVLPIFVPAAQALGMPAPLAAFAVAIAASCGFMLPVATPPNGLVFGTGLVPQGWMLRCGLLLNLLCALVLTLMVWGLMP